jgi:1,2-diacylglycerol 3-alpha-glucosyltransferase
MSVLLCAIWIDWYAYHVARFRALAEHPSMRGRVSGLELVGGSGVHQRMVFRSENRGNLPIETLEPQKGWSDVRQDRLTRLLWRKLDELNPEVVLVPGYYTAPALAAAWWAVRRDRKAILMTETTRADHRRVWWKETAKARMIRSLFDAAVTGGKRHVAYLSELEFPSSRIGQFYDVVDNEYYSDGAARLRAERTRKDFQLPDEYFLYVGRLSAEKNLELLIRSFTKLRDSGMSLLLVGDGPLRTRLEEQAREARLEGQVRFVGLKSTEEILPYYAFAHAFVLPSSCEPWGLVVNEAMAAGLPVIVSNRCGCASDLVQDGVNGFVFDPDHPKELADTLWSAARLNREVRDSMGRQSQSLISRYSPRHWAEEVFRLVCTVSRTRYSAA